MKINNVVRFEEKNQEEKKQAQKEINNYQRDPNLSELRPGESITQYLKNNIDNNMLTRWQHALTTVNKLKLDVVNEVIYEELFPDHAVEGGKRILDDDGWSSDDDGWSSDDDD